jgi:ankyrin repeat protein
MKRHLEDVKRVAEENAKKIAHDARIQAQKEARKELDLAKRSQQEGETEDVNKLSQEALEKDRHIEELKQEILKLRAQVNSSGSIARSNSSELQCKPRNQQTFTPSRKQSVNTRCLISTSLLDGDDHMNSLNCTTTTLNDSWSADFSNSFQFETPIHTAIRAADDDALSEAVTNCGDVPSDINRGGRDGRTPLHLAALGCNLPSAQFLLDNDSVPNAQDNSGNTALHYAKVNQMVKLLLEEGGANPNIPNSRGFCAIHLAVQRMDVKSVEYLLAHNAHVNVADDTNWQTPLHLVSQAQTPFESSEAPIKIATILCQATNKEKVDINYQDIHGNTPMHVSAVLKGEKVCDLMFLYLEHGGDPNIQNHRGQTPLHLVLHNAELREGDHYYEMIRLMLHHGGDPNIPSLSGCTPLHLSLYHQDIRSTLLLTEKGAQLHLPWEKPNRWHTHWVNTSHDGIVFCFEMIDDIEILRKIISVISCKQKDAPRRQKCMQCKRKFGKFGRQYNCGFCGSLVCSQCAPTTLGGAYFPPCFDDDILQENTRVCILCEQMLITRKQENDLMGKEVYAIHGDEDVSFLGNDTSFQGQEDDEAIVQFSSLDVEM